jgi:hypothetical protein
MNVSRCPARKVVDHDGGLMQKTSKDNSKRTSCGALDEVVSLQSSLSFAPTISITRPPTGTSGLCQPETRPWMISKRKFRVADLGRCPCFVL